MSAEQKPLHVIRNLADGTQELRSADNQTLIKAIKPGDDGVMRHHVKQKDEHVTLVPGHPDHVAVVHRIYRRHFIDGMGVRRIVNELNTDGVPSPTGIRWSLAVLRRLLGSPIYFGYGIGNRSTDAEFYTLGETIPQSMPPKPAIPVGEEKAEKEPLSQYRSQKDWFEKKYDVLDDYLGLEPALKQQIVQWQRGEMERLAAKIVKKAIPDPYPESDFILKGLLYSKQGDYRMTGCKMRQPWGQWEYRYYRVNRGSTHPKKGCIISRCIPADMLENAAISVVQEAVSSYDGYVPVVRAVMDEERQSKIRDKEDVKKLVKEREAVEDTIEFYVRDMIGVLGIEAVRQKTEPMREELMELNRRIAVAKSVEYVEQPLVAVTAEAVEAKCRELASSLAGMERMQVRNLLHVMMGKAVVDLETRETEFEVRMPSWALSKSFDVCAPETSQPQFFGCAYEGLTVPLGRFRCEHFRVKQKPCMTCKRVPRSTTPVPDTDAIAVQPAEMAVAA